MVARLLMNNVTKIKKLRKYIYCWLVLCNVVFFVVWVQRMIVKQSATTLKKIVVTLNV